MQRFVAREQGEGSAVSTLTLQTHAGGIGRGVQCLIRAAVIWSGRYADRDGDSGRWPAVRTRKEMAAYRRAESFSDLSSGRRRRAKKRDKFVSAWVGYQLSFAEIRPNQVEDRAQHRLGIWLTKLVGKPSIVIDVGNEQGYRTMRFARLGDRCRGGIDEGVVRGEPSLLIEKNEMLLQSGRSRTRPQCFESGGKDNRKNEGPNDAREKWQFVSYSLHRGQVPPLVAP